MNTEKALLVKPSQNLDFEQRKACIKAQLIEILKEKYKYHDLNVLRLDIGFLKHVCNILETGIKKTNSKKYKLDKKQIVLEALEVMIPTLTSPEMKAIISKNIESLHDEGLIKAVSDFEYYGTKAVKFMGKYMF